MASTVLRNTIVPPFPVNTAPIEKSTEKSTPRLTYPHVKFFQSVEQGLNSSAQTTPNIPASSTSTGEAGTFAFDKPTLSLFVCMEKNFWVKFVGTAF
jgi:hypothetical protein